MAEGRNIGHLEFDGETYLVREHGERYHPPVYVKQCETLSRDVLYGDQRIQFYKTTKSDFRVTFEFNGVWCYIPKDGNEGKANPQTKLMNELGWTFQLIADSELISETENSPFR